MNDQLQEILNTLYEAEALIEMAMRRDGNKGVDIARLGLDKCYQAADMAAAVALPTMDGEDVSDISEEPDIPELPEPETELTPEVEEDAVQVFEKEVLPALTPETDTAIFDTDEEQPEPEEEDQPDQPDLSDESDMSDESDLSERSDISSTPTPAANRKPIKSFFTLNDDFRFRRELFSNSGPDYKASLDLLETMDTTEEACEYFFDEMQWDPESEDVKAFIEIIKRYFNSAKE